MTIPADARVPLCSELSADDQEVPPNQEHLLLRHGQRHPFEIHEVLLLVGSFLERSSMTRAVRVSRRWHAILLPLVWEDIDLTLEAGSCPEVKALQSISSFVKHLTVTVVDVISLGNTFTCPNLVELTLVRVKNVNEECIGFIQRHRSTLTSISTSYSAEGELLEAIIECPRLKSLSFHMSSVSSSEWMSVYKRLWCRLESLHFRGCWSPSSSEEPESIEQLVAALSSASGSVPTAKIQTLLIDPLYDENPTTVARLLWLLQQCPELRHLQWSTGEESDVEQEPMRLLAQEMQSGHCWDKLGILVLPQSFYLNDFIVVMEGIVRLKELDLRGTGFNLSTWLALKEKAPRHLSTLTHLCLLECRQVDGPVVHDILCSCPNLEGFEAHNLRDMDMDDRPWVCLGLKSMLLTLKEDPDSEEESVIVSRLSTLVNLEVLILYKSRFRLCLTDEDDGGPLHRLQTLGRLKFFSGSIRDDQEVWGANEAEWILKNWPQLQTLHSVNMDSKDKALLGDQITVIN